MVKTGGPRINKCNRICHRGHHRKNETILDLHDLVTLSSTFLQVEWRHVNVFLKAFPITPLFLNSQASLETKATKQLKDLQVMKALQKATTYRVYSFFFYLPQGQYPFYIIDSKMNSVVEGSPNKWSWFQSQSLNGYMTERISELIYFLKKLCAGNL